MKNKTIENKVILQWSSGEDGPLTDTLTIQGANVAPNEKIGALFTALGETIRNETPENDARITATTIACEHLLQYVWESVPGVEPEDRLVVQLTMQLATWMAENTKAETPEEVRRMCQEYAEVLAERVMETAKILEQAEEAEEL